MKNKISILLPVFNDEEFISRCISSILENSYTNYELVIINDGSTDNSPEIINQFKDSRIKLYNKMNSGLIESLNYGIGKCSSEIIMRIDGDDEITENKIEIQLKSFINSNSVLHGTGAKIINNDSEIIKIINVPEDNNNILNNLNSLKTGLIHPSIMFYKDVIIKSGGYDSKFEVAEDYELYFRVSKLGELSNTNLPLLHLRKNHQNISKIKSNTQTLNTLIARRLYSNKKEIKKVNPIDYTRTRKEIENSISFKMLYKLNAKINNSSQENFINLFMKILRKIIIFFIKI